MLALPLRHARRRRPRGRAGRCRHGHGVPRDAAWLAPGPDDRLRVSLRRCRGCAPGWADRGRPLLRTRAHRRRRHRCRPRALSASRRPCGHRRRHGLPRRRDPRPGHDRARRRQGDQRRGRALGRRRRGALRAPGVHRHGVARVALDASRDRHGRRHAVAHDSRPAAVARGAGGAGDDPLPRPRRRHARAARARRRRRGRHGARAQGDVPAVRRRGAGRRAGTGDGAGGAARSELEPRSVSSKPSGPTTASRRRLRPPSGRSAATSSRARRGFPSRRTSATSRVAARPR